MCIICLFVLHRKIWWAKWNLIVGLICLAGPTLGHLTLNNVLMVLWY